MQKFSSIRIVKSKSINSTLFIFVLTLVFLFTILPIISKAQNIRVINLEEAISLAQKNNSELINAQT